MTGHLIVGLSSWVIQDGNYPDFVQGSQTAFALEFWAQNPLEEIEPDDAMAPSHLHRGSAAYDIVARVLHVAEHWWVIDVGVLVFQDCKPPPNARVGSWWRGEVDIAIDPFFYFEDHGHAPGVPAMIYEWRIDKIEIQTAPFVEISPRVFARDSTKLGWKEIAETHAWEDNGDYLLHCTHLAGPRLPQSRRQP
jgi:hypothetical protein